MKELLLCIAAVINGQPIIHTIPLDILELPLEQVRQTCNHPNVNGCYLTATFFESATIVIRNDWYEQTGPHTDTLVHELTHHVQAMQGVLKRSPKHEIEGQAEYAERAVPVYCVVPWR